MKKNKGTDKLLLETTNDDGFATFKVHKNLGIIATRVYFSCVVIFMLVVYVISLTINIIEKNEAGIAYAAAVIIPILICSFVVILTGFNLWVALFSKIFKNESRTFVNGKEIEYNDDTSFHEKLYIYKSHIKLVQNEKITEMQIKDITSVQIEKEDKCNFIFFNSDHDVLCATLPRSSYLIKRIKKALKCKVRVRKGRHKELDEDKMGKTDFIGGIFMLTISIIAGIVLLVLHYTLFDFMPVFLGFMFIFAGAAGLVGLLGKKNEWCIEVILPILFVAILFSIPIGLIFTYMDELKISFARVFVAQPYMICFIGICGIGLYLVFGSILNGINLISKKK